MCFCLSFLRAADSLPLASEADGEGRLRLGFEALRPVGVLVPFVEGAESFSFLILAVSSASFLRVSSSRRAVSESSESDYRRSVSLCRGKEAKRMMGSLTSEAYGLSESES